MPSPKEIEEKIKRMLEAWRTLAPQKTFGGMTLAQFEAACAPSLSARQRITELETQLSRETAGRDDAADAVFNGKAQLVVAGVLADPTEGADSPLYEAFGYTRKSEGLGVPSCAPAPGPHASAAAKSAAKKRLTDIFKRMWSRIPLLSVRSCVRDYRPRVRGLRRTHGACVTPREML